LGMGTVKAETLKKGKPPTKRTEPTKESIAKPEPVSKAPHEIESGYPGPPGETPSPGAEARGRLVLKRNIFLTIAGAFTVTAIWGLFAWLFALPLGGEVRSNPFQRLQWQISDVREFLLKDIPHPALTEIPDYFGWRLGFTRGGFLSLGQFEDDITDSPDSRHVLHRDGKTEKLLVVIKGEETPEYFVLASDSRWLSIKPSGIHDALVVDARGRTARFRRKSSSVDGAEELPLSGIAFPALGLATTDSSAVVESGDKNQGPFVLAIPQRVGSPAWAGTATGIVRVGPLEQGATPPLTVQRTEIPIRSIFFASPSVGWAFSGPIAGLPVVFQTLDAGQTWQRLSLRYLPAPWVLAAFTVALFAFAAGSRAWLALAPVASQQRIAEHGVSDDPISLEDDDALGLIPIARALSRFLRNVETKPTVAIGITGAWGSGKSSLMNLVREDLSDHRVRTVWFNAWHHQKEDNLLAALLATIRAQAVPPIWALEGMHYRLRLAWRRITQDAGRSLAFVILFATAIALVFTFGSTALQGLADLVHSLVALIQSGNVSGKTSASAGEAITSIGLSTGGIGGVAFGLKHIWELFKPLKAIPADLVAGISEKSRTKDLDAELSFRYRFTREFGTFCDTLRWPPFPGLVIFVDDLDRCGTQQTVDVLEAINFITSAGKCFVILGFDENKVKAAIADTYKKTLLRLDEKSIGPIADPKMEDLFKFATNYLEKLVHLIVPVPRTGVAAVERVLGIRRSVKAPDVHERRILRRNRLISELGGAAIVGAFLIAATLFGIGLLNTFVTPQNLSVTSAKIDSGKSPPASQEASSKSPPSANSAAIVMDSPILDSQPLLDRLGINPQRAFWAMPASIPIATVLFLIALMALQYVPRFSPDPAVEDSDDFRKALGIWAAVIASQRTTPRAVKRIVNRMRFLAMRIADAQEGGNSEGRVQLDEGRLVTYTSIEEANPEWLGKQASELGHGREGLNLVDPQKAHDNRLLVIEGLQRFYGEFGNPYPRGALAVYRAVAGAIEERGGAIESSDSDGSTLVAPAGAPAA